MPNSKDNDYNSKFDLEVPDDLDVSIELRNWLFALEGTEEVGDWLSPHGSDHISREEKCWHTTFTNLHVSGRSSDRPGSAEKVIHKRALPIERFTVCSGLFSYFCISMWHFYFLSSSILRHYAALAGWN